MPPKTTSTPAAAQGKEGDTNAFVNDYLADWDDDDLFGSPGAEEGEKNKKNDKKRKEPDALGIDEQIDLTKKPRAPRVKLDETRSVHLLAPPRRVPLLTPSKLVVRERDPKATKDGATTQAQGQGPRGRQE